MNQRDESLPLSRDAVDDPVALAADAHADAPAAPPQASAPATVRAMGQPHFHESARAQVAGSAHYIDDLPEVKGTLYAAPILSTVAHGALNGVDTTAALALPGVRGVVLAQDVPGDKLLAAFAHDEPVFATDTVQHVGQVIGLVVAESVMQARRAARAVQLDITPLPAILSVQEALKAQSFVLPPVFVRRGDAAQGLAQSAHRLQGAFEVGGQEHFYLEGQIAYALPLEQRQWWIYSSTQHPGEVQHWVAHALGIDNHAVKVECRRMGGGFGGKETQAGHLAVWAAVAANKLGRPVKLRLDRDDDFMVTGKRHPFAYEYDVGFDDAGRITGLKLQMAANCGFSADLSGPVADRAVFHADNAYYLSDVEIASYRCKTNTQSHTAFRGFGGPQGVIVIEAILGDIARALGRDAHDVRMANLYGKNAGEGRNVTHYQMTVEDNILHALLPQLEQSADYRRRQADIAAWNAQQPVLKRGMAITPVKFGISFTMLALNQAGALIHVYRDGSVQLNHGGTEMGQGLHTKIAQVVAQTLQIDIAQVKVMATATDKVPNASSTAASSGSDLNGMAAAHAAEQIRDRLIEFVVQKYGVERQAVRFEANAVLVGDLRIGWPELAEQAYLARIPLSASGFYSTPGIHWNRDAGRGNPYLYYTYGASCSEVTVDTLTGEYSVDRVDILHDVGRSLNPAIDIGQIEGGFVQGMGWLTTEELWWDGKGRLRTHAPSTYKIPVASDIPKIFNVKLADWSVNRATTIGRSKAVGEPPFMLALSVFEALGMAAASVADYRIAPRMDAPATPERVLMTIERLKREAGATPASP